MTRGDSPDSPGTDGRDPDDGSAHPSDLTRRDALAGIAGTAAFAGLAGASRLPTPSAPSTADFVVERSGGGVVARNGSTGSVVYRGSDAATVVQEAVGFATTGDRVVVRGDFRFTRSVEFRDEIRYEHHGRMTLDLPPGEAGLVIGDADNQLAVSEFLVAEIVGKNHEADAIRIQNAIQSLVGVEHVRDCRYGIYCPQVAESVQITGLKLVFGAIHRCLKGYYVPEPPSGQKPVLCQGNELFGKILSMAEHGIRMERGQASGGMIFRGTIDTRGFGGDSSRDYVNDFFDTQLGSVIAGTIGRLDTCQFHRTDVLLSSSRGSLLSGPGGRTGVFPDAWIERVGPEKARTDSSFAPRCDAGNFGGDFSGYAPPPGHDGAMLIAVDEDATPPKVRKYVHASGRWHYRELTV